MPSLFSRSRTNSTPNKKHSLHPAENTSPLDEFGRISSRGSNLSYNVNNVSPVSKKDKKKAREQEKRLWSPTSRTQLDYHVESPVSHIPDGSFLPLNLERPRTESGLIEQPKEHDYGYLSYERHVVLGVEQIARLVEVVSEELTTRGGITTPFIFSTTALDISSSAIKRLIRAFLNTCQPNFSNQEEEMRWREEARFAEPHELGMCLRWGLARVVRSVGGHDVRGLIAWDKYVEFRDSEAALGYPPAHFTTLFPGLPTPLQPTIITLLTLLSRLTANSTTSGHTPPTLSPLFGPLLFGLGPATLAFHHTYIHYLRAAHAMEHVLLAFIRWQDSPRPVSGAGHISGSAAALGVPTRLKEWIKGYPSMLPIHDRGKHDKPQARRGARTVRVMSVRRNVRMYSPDLVKTAATWAHRSRSGTSVSENGLAVSKEWDRIAPASLKLPPRYSEAFKKRMDMPPNFHPDSSPGSLTVSPGLSSAPSAASNSSNTSASTNIVDHDYFGLGLGARQGEDRFRSLTDLKWGEFESMGFSELGDQKKLQFDLTESARTERSAKRQTLSWNDFSSAGFSRGDGPLSATLQFSAPVIKSVSTWPAHNAEMSKKLKKTQKLLPPFGWDTEPVVGSEEVIEDAFVDVFCDLVYGGGWMDLERYEELDRDCNWALVEFKSLPPSRTTAHGGSDPRTGTTLILFEEFVPLEYRQQLALPSSTRRRLPSLFTPSKSKQWKQAPTLNGRPYVVGHVPRSPSYREVEFEGLLRGGSGTKVISLGAKPSIRASQDTRPIPEISTPTRPTGISAPLYIRTPEPNLIVPPKSEDMHSDSTMAPSVTSMKRASLFRLPGGIPVPSPGGHRKSGIRPAEYSTLDFETRLASYSDDESNAVESEVVKQKRRESKDEAWVDILVGTQARRMANQDVTPKEGQARRRVLSSRRSDPDMASLEVAQVLAAVRDNRPLSVVNLNERVDHDYGVDNLHDHLHDHDVDEIETVPRTSGVRTEDDKEEEQEEEEEEEEEQEEEQEEEEQEEVKHYAVEPPLHHEHEQEDADDEFDGPTLPQRLSVKQQRRLGYFDLHPERRRPMTADPIDQDADPRDRLVYDDSDDEADDEERYGPSQPPQPPVATIRKLPVPPEPQRALPVAPVPERKLQVETTVAPSGSEPKATSKTAALIEMYRERERSTPPKPTGPAPLPPVPAPLPPSRLPVRTSSKEGASLPERATATPSPIPSLPIEIKLTEPPRIVLEESGRASPARYVHGAPLHNVVEEEEEE